VDLPGVGYAILNEQIPTGNGVTSWGMTVNMIHVVFQDFPRSHTGEIIIGLGDELCNEIGRRARQEFVGVYRMDMAGRGDMRMSEP